MLRKGVAIIHYMPLEIYPPVMNLVRTWDTLDTGLQMDVYTINLDKKKLRFQPLSKNTRVNRYGVSDRKHGFLLRFWLYFYYYIATLFMLIKTRPANVLYFDTISSFPAILYKMIWRNHCRLFVHYNEYMSEEEYRHGMFLVKWFHQLEKKIYDQTAWLSHTNQERMDLFKADLPGVIIPHSYILPNFPPAEWNTGKQSTTSFPLKIVYTGALSMDTMYTRLFAEWVLKQNGAVTWDIYSLNITAETVEYIKSLPGIAVTLHEGIDYYSLPGVLKLYDVGIILYSGHIPNYIFNAPNKLFEYAAVGMDVWFPHHMQSSRQYITVNSYPKIIAVNFQLLDEIKIDQLTSRSGLVFQPHPFTCEPVLLPLLEKLAV